MGGISAKSSQIGLAYANQQRYADADYRQQKFDELYLQHRTLSDKEMRQLLMKELGISRGQYYLAKQRSKAK